MLSAGIGMVLQSCRTLVKRLRSDLTYESRTDFKAKAGPTFRSIVSGFGRTCAAETFSNQEFRATILSHRRAHLFDGRHQTRRQSFLCRRGELFALAGQVEDVDRRFAFCIDQGNFDVALQSR